MPITIKEIDEDSPLHRFDVIPGDFITKINGKKVNSREDFLSTIKPNITIAVRKEKELLAKQIEISDPDFGVKLQDESDEVFHSSIGKREDENPLSSGQNNSSAQEDDTQPGDVMKVCAWVLLVVYAIAAIYLVVEFGTVPLINERGRIVSEVPNWPLFAGLSVGFISNIFLISLANVLCVIRDDVRGLKV